MDVKKFLFFGCSSSVEKAVKQAFNSVDIEIEFIPESRMSLPVGCLLGVMPMPKVRPKQSGGIDMPFMLMSGISREELENSIEIIKKSGIRIPLKAMVTETNIMWSASYLYGELNKEYQYFYKGDHVK